MKNLVVRHGHIAILLMLIAAAIRLYFAQADPFLHDWDERFHALVARNMMDQPFKPMLKTSALLPHEDYTAWCCNHIWLHKQPLFMWQMALSMKVFGVSELALRLPSVIMGALMILLLYRITVLVTGNKTAGLIAAGLLCFSHYHLTLIMGIKGMDHNDVAFGFYVLASLWAYAAYERSGKWYWVLLIGLFSGCAILNKWLTGLAVFLAWGVNLLIDLKHKDRKDLVRFMVALAVCCIVFIPWQIYIHRAFPEEARYEAAYNTRHIFEALEGHTGSIWYYLRAAGSYFGSWLWLGIAPGILLAFFMKRRNSRLLYAFTVLLLFVLCFFSFIVQTKVHSYFFMIAPICMMFIAISLYAVCFRSGKRWAAVVVLPVALWLSLRPGEWKRYFSADNHERNRKVHNTAVYKNIRNYIPEHVKIVVGLNEFEDVELMFYHKDIAAIHWWLPPEDMERLAAEQVPVATFKSREPYVMPSYLPDYPYLYIIDKTVK